MFTFADNPVKFVGLLILFAFSIAWSLYQLARRQTGLTLVSNLAHLAMSVVMLLMVPHALWQPFVAAFPLPTLVGFFGIFVLWFVYLGIRGFAADDVPRVHAWHALGHGAMFGAMTWHLSGMLAHTQSMIGRGSAEGVDHAGGAGMDHGAMAHGSTAHGTLTPASPLTPPEGTDPAMAVAWVGVPFMAYLLIAAIANLKNAISPGRDILDHAGHIAAGHGHYVAGDPRLAALADLAMHFGMFWMSTGLMVPLLPFFAAF